MSSIVKHAILTIILSTTPGIAAIAMVAAEDNGYVAGFVFFPLMLLIGLISVFLLLAGLITIGMGKNAGPWLLLAALLMPLSFFGSSFIAKHFEFGAYREDHMVPIIPEIANIVIFKKGVTNEQISVFWEGTLSTKLEDNRGNSHLPGLGGIGRLPAREGHEVIEFSFFDSATADQREFVYSRVRSSPIVAELRENVPTKDYMIWNSPSPNDNRPKKELRKVETK